MNDNNGFGKNTVIGGALLLASLVIAVIGVIVSMKTGANRYFLVASIPTAALVVAGGLKIRQGMLMGEDRLLLPGGEQTITAEVLGVTRNLRTAGEKTAYYIVCRHKNPITGKEETYSSRPLAEYPGKEVIGKQVTVRLDPLEKGKYTVEIDPLLEEVQRERKMKAQADTAAESRPVQESAPQADAALPVAASADTTAESAPQADDTQPVAESADTTAESAQQADAAPQPDAGADQEIAEDTEEEHTGGEDGGPA